jgi:galactonate dehydratase
MGVLFAKALEPYNLYWFEEPCWPEVMDDIAAIQRAVKTPIATGERLVGVHAFRELFEKRAASVIQPDITHCGGLSEARRIAGMAEAYRVAVAPHNPQGPISTAASLEFGFATPSYVICETVHGDVPWRGDIVKEGFTIEKKGRIVRANTRPGLGIEINEDEVRRHPFKQEELLRTFHKDGSVGDW